MLPENLAPRDPNDEDLGYIQPSIIAELSRRTQHNETTFKHDNKSVWNVIRTMTYGGNSLELDINLCHNPRWSWVLFCPLPTLFWELFSSSDSCCSRQNCRKGYFTMQGHAISPFLRTTLQRLIQLLKMLKNREYLWQWQRRPESCLMRFLTPTWNMPSHKWWQPHTSAMISSLRWIYSGIRRCEGKYEYQPAHHRDEEEDVILDME